MTLIDVLYEKHIRVFCSADGEPSDLFANIMTMQEARSQKSNMVGLLAALYSKVLILWIAFTGFSLAQLLGY